MAIGREWVIGQHKAHFEEPDLLIAKMGAPVGIEDAKRLTALYRELGTAQPYFIILDVTGCPADAAARSHFTREIRLEWFRGVVYVGAGLVERAVTKAMTVAFLFMGRTKLEFSYAKTIEEARGLIEQMRARQSSQPLSSERG